jgi:hypothetical protein
MGESTQLYVILVCSFFLAVGAACASSAEVDSAQIEAHEMSSITKNAETQSRQYLFIALCIMPSCFF